MTPDPDDYTGPTAGEAADRARRMKYLPERERDLLISVGVMQHQVIDARHRFDPDRLLPTLSDLLGPRGVTTWTMTTVFDGVFGPEDCA